jgi:hypothetical protein
MRTQEELVKRFNDRRAKDIFGWEVTHYLECMDYEHAKPHLQPDVTPDQWESESTDRDAVVARMLDYMPFAWEKANDMRDLSAGRSVMHFVGWLWLAGETELSVWCDDDQNYYHYGKPILQRICEHYGWDWKSWDDGVRTNGD